MVIEDAPDLLSGYDPHLAKGPSLSDFLIVLQCIGELLIFHTSQNGSPEN
jgi:hypothetical protein